MKLLLAVFVLAAVVVSVANGAPGGVVPYNGGGGGGGGGYYGGMNQPVRPNMGQPVQYGVGPVRPPPRPVFPKKPSNVQGWKAYFTKQPKPNVVPDRVAPGGPDPHHHFNQPNARVKPDRVAPGGPDPQHHFNQPNARVKPDRVAPGGPDPQHHRRLLSFGSKKKSRRG